LSFDILSFDILSFDILSFDILSFDILSFDICHLSFDIFVIEYIVSPHFVIRNFAFGNLSFDIETCPHRTTPVRESSRDVAMNTFMKSVTLFETRQEFALSKIGVREKDKLNPNFYPLLIFPSFAVIYCFGLFLIATELNNVVLRSTSLK
jgi:hypothetical protein